MKKYLQDHRKRAKRTTWSGIKQNAVSCSKNLLELNTAADTFIHYQLSLQTLPTHEECVAPNQFFFSILWHSSMSHTQSHKPCFSLSLF